MSGQELLFEMPVKLPKHPAKYTDVLLGTFVDMLSECTTVLDPFGGTGKVYLINQWLPSLTITAVEIESEWALYSTGKRMVNGDATMLPIKSRIFDAVCTSPTYGNSMASTPRTKPRISYVDQLGRRLATNNTGGYMWGDMYRELHSKTWAEVSRVLKPDGFIVLNIKNHIKDGKLVDVTGWHVGELQRIGFIEARRVNIPTPGMRRGRNHHLRVGYESVIKFERTK